MNYGIVKKVFFHYFQQSLDWFITFYRPLKYKLFGYEQNMLTSRMRQFLLLGRIRQNYKLVIYYNL